MNSLGIEFPKEQKRLRELLHAYKSLGYAGLFLAGRLP